MKKDDAPKRRWCSVLGCNNFQSTPSSPNDTKVSKFPSDLTRLRICSTSCIYSIHMLIKCSYKYSGLRPQAMSSFDFVH